MDIDITDLVETMRSTFVTWSVNSIYASAIAYPGLQWLALPIVNYLFRGLLKIVVDLVSKQAALQLFFMNTAMRKASQATDYVKAVRARQAAKPEDYERAELYEIAAFNAFVRLDR